MASKSALYVQCKKLLPCLTAIYSPTVFALLLLVAVSRRTGIPIAHFTRDTVAVAEAPVYTGLFSNIGILFWCSTAAISLFSSNMSGRGSKQGDFSVFLLVSGLLTSLLLLDDLFLLHEEVLPEYLHIPQKLVFLGYGLVMLLYLFRFRTTIIMHTDWFLLLFALGFFGLSIVFDNVPFGLRERHLFEDGSKLLGIVSWTSYFTRTCMQLLTRGESIAN